MNIEVTAKGQACDRALAVGSRTGWFKRESAGAAVCAVCCNTPIRAPIISWDLTSKAFEGDALSS